MSRSSRYTKSNSLASDYLWLLLCLILGAAIRLDFLLASNFVLDADEAIVGLMAKHITEGAPWPTFYYGQHYMGSFEALCAALLFLFVGPSSWALKMVPLAFSLLLIPILYGLGRELGGRTAGRISALLGALPPVAFVVWSTKARGGFIELIVIGALALLIGLRWLRAPSHARVALVGLLLGLGWWVNNQIIYFILVLGLALSGRLLRDRSDHMIVATSLGVITFFVGGLPYWLYNLSHQFISFDMLRPSSGTTVFDHAAGLFTVALPILFGSVRNWSLSEIFPGAKLAGYLLHGGLLLIAFLIALRDTYRRGPSAPPFLTVIFLIGAWSIFCISSFGWLSQEPRYLLPTYVGIFVLEGWLIGMLHRLMPLLARIICAALLSLHIASCYYGGRALPGQPFVTQGERVATDQRELIDWLQNNSVRHVRTNYWIGYRLAFETNEQTTFTIFQPPHERRIQAYQRADLTPWDSVPYVLVPKQAAIVAQALRALGSSFAEEHLSGYHVIHSITWAHQLGQAIDNGHIVGQATAKPEDAYRALDGDPTTRWGSGAPQDPSMEFSLELTTPQPLSGLMIDLGTWTHDAPRDLTLTAEGPDGTTTVLWSSDDYRAVRYLMEAYPRIEARFEPRLVKRLVLNQLGSDPIFDWSIAEIRLFAVR